MKIFVSRGLCTALSAILTFQTFSFAQTPFPISSNTVSAYQPPMLKGLIIKPDPMDFDFVLDPGSVRLKTTGQITRASEVLIKYFLTSLAFPEDDLWVNLSPEEPNRIIPDGLAKTDMGQVMLAQDYLLKQMASQLMNPETPSGEAFWNEIFNRQDGRFINTGVDLASRVWIKPGSVTIIQESGQMKILESRLEVMLEHSDDAQNKIFEQAFRHMILPRLAEIVNTSRAFAPLRQVYHSFLLAAWYQRSLKNSFLNHHFTGRRAISGFMRKGQDDETRQIYQNYMTIVRDGAFNMIREDVDPLTGSVIPRHYFSGGERFNDPDFKKISAPVRFEEDDRIISTRMIPPDSAMMLGKNEIEQRKIFASLIEMAEQRPHIWPVTRVSSAFIASPERPEGGGPFIALGTNIIGLHSHSEIMLLMGVLKKEIFLQISDEPRRNTLLQKLNTMARVSFLEGKLMDSQEGREALEYLLEQLGDPFRNGTFYVNAQPCENCTKVLSLLGLKKIVYQPYPDAKFVEKANKAMEPLKQSGTSVQNTSSDSLDFGINHFFQAIIKKNKDESDRIQARIYAHWTAFARRVLERQNGPVDLHTLEKLADIFLTAFDQYILTRYNEDYEQPKDLSEFLQEIMWNHPLMDAYAEKYFEIFAQDNEGELTSFLNDTLPIDDVFAQLNTGMDDLSYGSRTHAVVYASDADLSKPDAAYWRVFAGDFQKILYKHIADADPYKYDLQALPRMLSRILPKEFRREISDLFRTGRARYQSRLDDYVNCTRRKKSRRVVVLEVRRIAGRLSVLVGKRDNVDDYSGLFSLPSGEIKKNPDPGCETASEEQKNLLTADYIANPRPEFEQSETILAAGARHLKNKTGIDIGGAGGFTARLDDLYNPHTGELFHFLVHISEQTSRAVPKDMPAENPDKRMSDFQWIPVDLLTVPQLASHPNGAWESVQTWIRQESENPTASLLTHADAFSQLLEIFATLFHEELLPPARHPHDKETKIPRVITGEVRNARTSPIPTRSLGTLTLSDADEQIHWTSDDGESLQAMAFKDQQTLTSMLMKILNQTLLTKKSTPVKESTVRVITNDAASEMMSASMEDGGPVIVLNIATLRQIPESIRRIYAALLISHGILELQFMAEGQDPEPLKLVDDEIAATQTLLRESGVNVRDYVREISRVLKPGSLYLDGLYMVYTLQIAVEASQRGTADQRGFPIAALAVNRNTGEMIAGMRQLRTLAHGPQFHTHVEIESLREAVQDRGWETRDIDLYISLESCISCASSLSSFFRPARVVFGTLDSYTTMRGRGLELMRRAGLDVRVIPLVQIQTRAQAILSEFFKNDPTPGNAPAESYSFQSMAHEVDWYLSHPTEIYKRMLKIIHGYPGKYPDLKELNMLTMLYIKAMRLLPPSQRDPWPKIVTINANHMTAQSSSAVTNHLTEIASLRSRFPNDPDFKVVLIGDIAHIKRVYNEILAHAQTDLARDGGISASQIYVLMGNKLFTYKKFYDLVDGGFQNLKQLVAQSRKKKFIALMGSARFLGKNAIESAEEFGRQVIRTTPYHFKNGGGPTKHRHPNAMRNSLAAAFEEKLRLVAEQGKKWLEKKIFTVRIILTGQAEPCDEADYEVSFYHFPQRIWGIMHNTSGVGFFEGGAGSFDELFFAKRKGLNIVLRKIYRKFFEPLQQALQNVGLDREWRRGSWPAFADRPERMLEKMAKNLRTKGGKHQVFSLNDERLDQLEQEVNAAMDFTNSLPSGTVIFGTPVYGNPLWIKKFEPIFEILVPELLRRGETIRLASPSMFRLARASGFLGRNGTVSPVRIHGIFCGPEMSRRHIAKEEIATGLPQSIILSEELAHTASAINNSRAVILFPGSDEVISALMYLLDAMQTGTMPQVPIVLVGKKDFWGIVLKGFMDTVSKDQNGFEQDAFNMELLDKLLFFVEKNDDIARVLDDPNFWEVYGQGARRTEAGEVIPENGRTRTNTPQDPSGSSRDNAALTKGGIDLDSDLIRWEMTRAASDPSKDPVSLPEGSPEPQIPTSTLNLIPRIYKITPFQTLIVQ